MVADLSLFSFLWIFDTVTLKFGHEFGYEEAEKPRKG
jgi:hypothetical protein